MKKYFYNLTALVILAIANLSAHKSIWPNCDYISTDGKYFCTQFQFLNGSNRTAEFKSVFPTIFNNQGFEANKNYSSNKFTSEELLKLLGEPSSTNGDNEFTYLLNPDVNNCTAKFTYNKENNTVTCTTTNLK